METSWILHVAYGMFNRTKIKLSAQSSIIPAVKKYFIMLNYREEKFLKKEKILEWITMNIRKGSKTVSYLKR